LTANLRVFAFVVIAGAALAGIAARVAIVRLGAPEITFAGIESIDRKVGQPLADATFDGIAEEAIASVRLSAKGCGDPIFAAPILLTAVEIPQSADRAYLKDPRYRSVDVYDGEVRRDFSHIRRLIARALLETYNSEPAITSAFIRPRLAKSRTKNSSDGRGRFLDWPRELARAGTSPKIEGVELP
jgi:hypothetical protein